MKSQLKEEYVIENIVVSQTFVEDDAGGYHCQTKFEYQCKNKT